MNLKHNKSPCCDSAPQLSDMNYTLNEYSLMTQMLSDHNMGKAWRHVKANKGSPGIDRMSIVEAESFLVGHWKGIKAKLNDGSYYPKTRQRRTFVGYSCRHRQDDPASH